MFRAPNLFPGFGFLLSFQAWLSYATKFITSKNVEDFCSKILHFNDIDRILIKKNDLICLFCAPRILIRLTNRKSIFVLGAILFWIHVLVTNHILVGLRFEFNLDVSKLFVIANSFHNIIFVFACFCFISSCQKKCHGVSRNCVCVGGEIGLATAAG